MIARNVFLAIITMLNGLVVKYAKLAFVLIVIQTQQYVTNVKLVYTITPLLMNVKALFVK